MTHLRNRPEHPTKIIHTFTVRNEAGSAQAKRLADCVRAGLHRAERDRKRIDIPLPRRPVALRRAIEQRPP